MPIFPQLNSGLVKPDARDLRVQLGGKPRDKFLVAAGIGDEDILGHVNSY